MQQYDKRFMFNVNVVYRLQIADKDSEDLRTSSRSGQKVIIQYQSAFHSCSWSRFTRSWTIRRQKVACSDSVWRIITCPPVLISFCGNWCTERLRWTVADLSPRRPRCRPQASSSGIEMDSVSMGQVYLRVLQHFPDYIIPPLLHPPSFIYHG